LVPGDTSAVERGPWHYGADYVTVYFEGDLARLSYLVPKPFKVTDGRCMAYVCEIVSVSHGGADMVASEPDRTLYQEAAVGLRCEYKGKAGVYFPVMWVTTEWSLLRGLLNGYQKRLADKIAITKIHPLNPGLKPIGPGSQLGGFCVKGGQRTLSLRVTVKRAGAPSDLPVFGVTFGRRAFPRTDESQGSIEEAVEILKSNSRSSDVWLGDGTVETTLPIGEPKATIGASYRTGFTISGSRALE